MKFAKGLVKWGIIAFGGFVLLALIISFTSNEQTVKTDDGTTVTVNKKDNSVNEQNTKKQDAAKITEANFDKIQEGKLTFDTSGKMFVEGGMTFEEVESILGKAGTKSKSTSKTGESQMEIEAWMYSDFKTGESITVSFTNGKVTSKTHVKI